MAVGIIRLIGKLGCVLEDSFRSALKVEKKTGGRAHCTHRLAKCTVVEGNRILAGENRATGARGGDTAKNCNNWVFPRKARGRHFTWGKRGTQADIGPLLASREELKCEAPFVRGDFLRKDLYMTRLTLTLAVWMNLVSLASATVTHTKKSPLLNNAALKAPSLLAEGPELTLERRSQSEYVVTERTEILLDGETCKYEQVPAHATITRMEVAADRKTVLKIHFRRRK